MRLEATVRYLLKPSRIKISCYIIVILIVFSIESKSQDFTLTFENNTTLAGALIKSSETFGFKVAFDARQLEAVYCNKQVSAKTLNDFIALLLENTGFTYLYKHGSYLIINSSNNNLSTNECQLIGSVIDSETGEQLPFATVLLPSQNIVVSASANGNFSIKNIISNPVAITVSYIGYYSLDTLVKWTNSNIDLIFKLKQRINIIEPVKVNGIKVEMVDYRSNDDFSTTINPAKLIDLPVMAETDIFKTLQLLPGISYSESSSELSIRGGTSDQNLVLFDGQTLYNLSHYYGVFSAINPNIVKDIQVFKGGFDSRYGERISGIVDITGKSGNQKKVALCADINLLSVNLAVEIPVTKKITIVAAARRSYSDIYKTAFAENLFENTIPIKTNRPNEIVGISEPSFHFYDLNTKINYRVSKSENFSLSLYGGKDFFKNSYSVDSRLISVSTNDSNYWYNYGVSANWQKQWNSSYFSSFIVGSSGYKSKAGNLTSIERLENNGQGQILPDTQNIFEVQSKNELKDYFVTMQNTLSINSFNQLNFGFLIRENSVYYHKDADDIYVYDNTNQSAWIASVNFQDRIVLYKNLSIKPGFRLNYYSGTGQLYFEPRFAAKYDFTEKFSSRLAVGRYNQFISQAISQQETSYNKYFWVLANDSVNPVLTANHFIFGSSYTLKNIMFDVEAYYKEYDGIQEYIYLSQFLRDTEFDNYFPRKRNNKQKIYRSEQPSYFIDGSGKSFGIDCFMRYKASFYTSWLSYSLSKNIQTFDLINYSDQIPALTDRTHQVSLSNLFTIGKWNIGAITLFSTGSPYIVSSVNERNLPIIRTYSRLPNYFRCDLSANYNFNIKAVRFKTGISLINLLNNQNYYDVNTRTYDFENTSFSETNLIQSQQLSVNVFLHISL